MVVSNRNIDIQDCLGSDSITRLRVTNGVANDVANSVAPKTIAVLEASVTNH